MKRILVFLVLALALWAAPAQADEYRKTISPTTAATITHPLSRGVFIGVAGNYDFYVNGAWVLFTAPALGTILPIRVTGARDADDSDAEAGDLLLLY